MKIKECECVGMLEGGKWDKMHDNIRRVYSPDAATPSLTACCGGNHEAKIYDAYNQREISSDYCGTITTCTAHNGSGTFYVENPLQFNRIRKLTPRECFRLMGVKDADYERIALNQSDSSLYHLAGDSIVTTVLMAIFSQMVETDWRECRPIEIERN